MSYGRPDERELRAPDGIATDEADEPGHSGIVHHHECIRNARRSFENPSHVVSDTLSSPAVTHLGYSVSAERGRGQGLCRKRAGFGAPDTDPPRRR